MPRPFNGEMTVFSTDGAWTTGQLHTKDPYLTTYINMNSKCKKDLNVRAKTIKLLTGSIGLSLHDLGLNNGFLNMTPKEQITATRTPKQIN